MKKAAFACALILVSVIVSVSIIAQPIAGYDEPSVGVKEGDWIEFDVDVTGTGAPPPTHDVRWFRMQILQIQGAAFSVNLTARYANGTVGCAIWKFNFTEGNVEGWIIIPSNLGPGDTFYDLSMHTRKPVYVTIQGQEQKTVLGATRTVTYGSDSLRHKEWDKTTGVFVGSLEHLKNVTNKDGWYIEDLTVNIQAIATNMWSTQISPDQTGLYVLAAVGVMLAALVPSAAVAARRKRIQWPSQGKVVVLTILVVVLAEIGTILFFPFLQVGLSFAEFNLIMQTFWTVLVLASMWFRLKGNYFAHEITMLVVMCAWIVGFSAVLLMDPFSSSSSDILANTPLRLVMNSLHAIFSIPALVFGLWLVALWRPESTSFAAKSKRIAQLTTVFWIPSYVVGVLDFLVLHTTFFG
jgi:uncharacterized membrane protein YozB (DUF420 family)